MYLDCGGIYICIVTLKRLMFLATLNKMYYNPSVLTPETNVLSL